MGATMSGTASRRADCLRRRPRRRRPSYRQKTHPNLTNSQGCLHFRQPQPHPAKQNRSQEMDFSQPRNSVSHVVVCRRRCPPPSPLVGPPNLPPQRPNHLPVNRVELEHWVGLPLTCAVTGVLHHSLESGCTGWVYTNYVLPSV